MLPMQGALYVSCFQNLGQEIQSLRLNFQSLRLKIQSRRLKSKSLGLKFLRLGLNFQSLGLKFPSLGLKFPSLGPWFEPMKYAVRSAGATARRAEMPHSKAGTCALNELFFLLLHEKATPLYTHDSR